MSELASVARSWVDGEGWPLQSGALELTRLPPPCPGSLVQMLYSTHQPLASSSRLPPQKQLPLSSSSTMSLPHMFNSQDSLADGHLDHSASSVVFDRHQEDDDNGSDDDDDGGGFLGRAEREDREKGQLLGASTSRGRRPGQSTTRAHHPTPASWPSAVRRAHLIASLALSRYPSISTSASCPSDDQPWVASAPVPLPVLVPRPALELNRVHVLHLVKLVPLVILLGRLNPK